MERRLAAILAADVVGYSRLIRADEEGTIARLKALRAELVEPDIARHRGRVVKLMGDGMLVEFASVVDAVRAAVEIQRAVAQRNADISANERIEFRVGVNLGDVIIDGDDIHGDGVNMAARLEGLAEPGGVCISGKVHDEVRNRTDLEFEDIGARAVKNFDEPVRAWRWVAEGAAAAGPVKADAPLPLPDKPSIAVLPFDNMSGDPEQEYFADGMTEDVITALSQVRWLFVIARNSSFAYKGTSPDVRQVARDLGVRYVLEGSVRKGGDRVRISAQLIDAATGRHVWAQRYDRDLGDMFALQDEITETLIAAIEPELAGAERERAIRKPPETLDAWDWYQRGMWHHYRFTEEDNAEARVLFGKAIARDPTFSRALAALAHAHYWDILFDYTDAPEEALAEALQLARRAVSLDDKEPFAHFAMGRVETLRGEHESAIAELERAIELNPSFAHAYYGLAFALIMAGRPEDAIPPIDRALRLNPHDPSIWTFMSGRALALMLLKRHEEALEWARRSGRQANAGWLVYPILAATLGHLDETKEARAARDEAIRLKPDVSLSYFSSVWPMRDPAHLEHLLDGLKLAGWPR